MTYDFDMGHPPAPAGVKPAHLRSTPAEAEARQAAAMQELTEAEALWEADALVGFFLAAFLAEAVGALEDAEAAHRIAMSRKHNQRQKELKQIRETKRQERQALHDIRIEAVLQPARKRPATGWEKYYAEQEARAAAPPTTARQRERAIMTDRVQTAAKLGLCECGQRMTAHEADFWGECAFCFYKLPLRMCGGSNSHIEISEVTYHGNRANGEW